MDITRDNVREHGRNIRVHGNGFIQIDMPDHIRVHVFGHPEVPRQVSPTPIHDHRFGFYSNVLTGRLVNVEYTLRTSVSPEQYTHTVCSYEQSEGTENTLLVPTGEAGWLVYKASNVVMPGQAYFMMPGDLHETLTNEVTVTRMTKTPHFIQDYKPRVLCDINRVPDNTFHRDTALPASRLWEIALDSIPA